VVGAGAHERQAERDVDAALDAEVLDRNEPVVVRHRDDDVEFARMPGGVAGAHEDSVGSVGPAGVDPFAARRGDRGRDDAQLLVAEETAFAGVRVEPGDRDPRPCRAEPAQRRIGDPDRLDDRIEGDRVERAPQRHVDRHEDRLQLVVGQHHPHRRRRAAVGGERLQHLGMARVANARRGERLLVDRRGDDRRRFAAADERDRALDRACRRFASARVDAADRRGEQVGGDAADLQDRNAARRQRRDVGRSVDRNNRQHAAGRSRGAPQHADIPDDERVASIVGAEPFGDDLGADAARIAHRDGERKR